MSNIVVTGTTGSGKSTLAAAIARKTGRACIDLDDLSWNPGWRESTDEEFTGRIRQSLAAAPPQGWVVAGNYSRAQDAIWPQAHVIVCLDYSAPRIFWRLWWRTISRSLCGTPCCNGNRETLAKAFLSRDSILLWFFKSYRGRKKKTRQWLDHPQDYPHLTFLHFTHPRQTQEWMNSL